MNDTPPERDRATSIEPPDIAMSENSAKNVGVGESREKRGFNTSSESSRSQVGRGNKAPRIDDGAVFLFEDEATATHNAQGSAAGWDQETSNPQHDASDALARATQTLIDDARVEGQSPDKVFNDLRALINRLQGITPPAGHPSTQTTAQSTPPRTPPRRPTSSVPQTPWSRNTGSIANSTEHRDFIDKVLKEELGPTYVGIPGFFDAFFGEVERLVPAAEAIFLKCKEGDNPLYQENGGWHGWPMKAGESDVLTWFAELTAQLSNFADEHRPASGDRRRVLAQPNQPVQGSTAIRKLDIGFVEDASAVNSKYQWSQILVPGELKSNQSADTASKAWFDMGRYAREVLAAQDSRRFVLAFTLCGSLMRLWQFNRLGAIASSQFDVNVDGLQFVSTILGFLWQNKEQLGFDPTIISDGDKRYIEVQKDNRKERLVIVGKVIRRVKCIAGRATTCWKVYREGDDTRTPYVVKDSWQYPERGEEGELLRRATEKGVVNVAKYYHHETVCVGGQDDDICRSVRKGLDLTKATNYRPESSMPPPDITEATDCIPESSMPPPSTTGRPSSRSGSSSSVPGRKRPRSSTGAAPLPSSKRTCPSFPTKGEWATENRVHRRVIVCDYGQPIYKASTPVSLLAALEGCIKGYESLRDKAGILQGDISPNNLMVREEGDKSSWPSFLIDLDLALEEQRDEPSGARAKTGTRAFMAIGVLLGEEHSFMHDLESFFWVLFWICVHYDGPGEGRFIKEFDEWNYADTERLAHIKKGIIDEEVDFLKEGKAAFTKFYRSLLPCVNRLRRKVFPDGRRAKVPNPKLHSEMISILEDARHELEEEQTHGIARELGII